MAGLPDLLPVLASLVLGVLLRLSGVAGEREGQFTLRLVFTVCQPALVLLSVSAVDLTPGVALFAGVVPAMVAAGYVAGRLTGRSRTFAGPSVPVVVIASMMLNSGSVLPWAEALFGPAGVARIAVSDAVSAVLTFTWAYWTAARGNPRRRGGPPPVGRLLRSPPLYGVAAGLAVNLGGGALPGEVVRVLAPFASTTTVLIALGTGMLLTLPGSADLGRASRIVAARLGTSLMVALAVALLVPLSGTDRALLFLLAAAPVAFVTVTFAVLEELDVRLATASLSLSLLASVVLSPVVAVLLR